MQSLFIIMPKFQLSALLQDGLLIHLWKTKTKIYRKIRQNPDYVMCKNNFRSFLRLRATFDEIVPFGELIIKMIRLLLFDS